MKKGKYSVFAMLVFCSIVAPHHGAAVEISQVNIPDNVTLSDDTTLTLNGAGVRTKFFFDIYIGALYLKNKSRQALEILSDTQPKRVTMHFLHDSVSKEKITAGWTDGFEDNNTSESFAKLKDRLTHFNSYFTDVKKGDEIVLDYTPTGGTQVSINGQLKGAIEGHDFHVALLKVWLGDSPADSGLKKGMLGN